MQYLTARDISRSIFARVTKFSKKFKKLFDTYFQYTIRSFLFNSYCALLVEPVGIGLVCSIGIGAKTDGRINSIDKNS